MINRLGLVIHWIGYLCLGIFVGMVLYFRPSGGSLLEVMVFEGSSAREVLLSIVFWLAITSWPLKFILTGNKSIYPWGGEDNND